MINATRDARAIDAREERNTIARVLAALRRVSYSSSVSELSGVEEVALFVHSSFIRCSFIRLLALSRSHVRVWSVSCCKPRSLHAPAIDAMSTSGGTTHRRRPAQAVLAGSFQQQQQQQSSNKEAHHDASTSTSAPRGSVVGRLVAYLFAEEDAAWIGFYRMFWGAMLMWEIITHMVYDYEKAHYWYLSSFNFKYAQASCSTHEPRRLDQSMDGC